MFSAKRFIEFGICDSANILFFGKIFELSHSVYEEFFFTGNLEFDYFNHELLAVPLIHTSADFKKPITLHETLTVNLTVSNIGNSSFSLKFDFIDSDNQPKATVKTSHVFVDKNNFSKTDIPSDVLNLLEQHLSGN